MDKNEQLLKMDELRIAMRNREFDKAAEIADSLELKKIKDNNFLSVAAEAYERTHNYEDAKNVLELAYENTNAGRLIAYKLCLISIKIKDFDVANNYYEDFVEMAPRDTARYILKYRMAKAQGEPIEDLIAILEEYVNLDMEEKWAYELAKLYHKAGRMDECVDLCDEISLWFAEGKYVNKAMELKKMHAPLTAAQQEKYDENKMREEEKLQQAEVKEISIEETEQKKEPEEKTQVKKRRMPFEINPEMITATKVDGAKDEAKTEENEEQPNEVKMNGDMEEIVLPEEIDDSVVEEVKLGEQALEETQNDPVVETETLEEAESAESEPEINDEGDNALKTEKLTGINDVSDILRQLQERGILKAETVQQAVEIIDEAGVERKNEAKEVDRVEKPLSDIKEADSNNLENSTQVISEPDKADNKQVKEKKEEPVFDDSDIIYEEELKKEKVEKEEVENTISTPEEPSEMGNTRIFNKVQIHDSVEIEEQPNVSKVVKPPVQKIEENEQPLEVAEDGDSVPVLDLEFTAPKRDESNDIGQKNMYENIAANSDLGYKTDKLPTREELQAAIKKAEEAVANKEAVTAQENDETSDVKVKENPTSKVEILSGAGIVDEGEVKQSEIEPKVSIENETQAKEVKEPEDKTETLVKQEKNIVKEEPAKQKEKTPVVREDILSEAELTEFKNYLNVEGFESNVREVLQELIVNYTPNGKSDQDNVIIMGDEKTGKTTLAIELIKLVNRKRGRRNRRLAKVDANALNRKGFRYAITKLVGSDLIVENAEQLGKMTVSELIDVSGMFTDDMLIVLEGSTEGMELLLKESPRLESVFNHIIRIKEYDIKEWVEYGVKYAERKGYAVDELANLAFYKAIDDFFGVNKGIGQEDVEGIIDRAIAKSGRIGRKVKGIFGSRTDDEGLKILQESDFDI